VQNRPRDILALIAAAAVPLLAVPAIGETAGADVVVEITNLRNTRGTVMACMTSDSHRFPRCRDDTSSHRVSVPAAESLVLRFHNVTPGTYAIALLHDENGNGRSDRALSMIPREGFGFSRDAAVRMGPPSFEDAAITVGANPPRQTIRMRYML
jgi:uncharacterized protein (DUF2141 family)